MRKDVKEVYEFAVTNGFELSRFNGHYHMRHPTGAHITIPGSPSDRRALANAMADIRRALGLPKRRPGKRPKCQPVPEVEP